MATVDDPASTTVATAGWPGHLTKIGLFELRTVSTTSGGVASEVKFLDDLLSDVFRFLSTEVGLLWDRHTLDL